MRFHTAPILPNEREKIIDDIVAKKTEEGGMTIPTTNILGDCQGTD